MNISAIISGLVMAIIGAFLFVFSLNSSDIVGKFIGVFSGTLIFCIGIYMIINSKKEDEVEKIKTKNKKVRV